MLPTCLSSTAHHDFGYSERSSRSINLCIYLNEGMKGGETSFPRWRNGHTTKAMNMVPQKGKAMIFYMVNPDGNLDDLTQHAALPVTDGEVRIYWNKFHSRTVVCTILFQTMPSFLFLP